MRIDPKRRFTLLIANDEYPSLIPKKIPNVKIGLAKMKTLHERSNLGKKNKWVEAVNCNKEQLEKILKDFEKMV